MKLPRLQTLLWLLLLLSAAWALRAPFLGREFWSLDEGCTFTMAEQIRHGAVLYRDAADHRSPLVPYLKAVVFAMAGDWNFRAQHLALALLIGACAFGQLAFAQSLARRSVGVWSAVAFTVICYLLPGTVDSLGEHTEYFVIGFSTLGFCLFARAVTRGSFPLGVALGLAFSASTLCKQPGLFDFAVTWVVLGLLAWRAPEERRRLTRVFTGSICGFAFGWVLTSLYFWSHQAWGDFVYYSWTFNTQIYVREVPLLERLAVMRLTWDQAREWVPAAIVVGIPGILIALRQMWLWLRDRSRPAPVLPLIAVGWFASGVLSTGLSGRAFPHYAIQVIPGLALLCGLAVNTVTTAVRRSETRWFWRGAGWLTLGVVGVWSLASVRTMWLRLRPEDEPEQQVLRTLVQHYSSPRDKIFVWGYYPEGYAISRRLPATRFVNTNFLTGMVPWTNLSAEIDTRYAIVPGAWDAFWQDYRRSPPQVILDAPIRGYVKYPLLSQPRLRDEIIDHFAEVRSASERLPIRVFRRLAPPDPSLAPAPTAPDERLQISVQRESIQSDLVAVVVSAPSDATELTLRLGKEPYRQLHSPPGGKIDVRFLVRLTDLVAHGTKVDAVARCEGQLIASRSIDVARQLVLDLRPDEPSPFVRYSTTHLQAERAKEAAGWKPLRREGYAGWQHDGPFSLSFIRPEHMQVLHFGWLPAIEDSAPRDTAEDTIAVQFEPESGPIVKLPVAFAAGPSGLKEAWVEIPQRSRGKLTLSSQGAGRVWIGNLNGYAYGPAIQFGGRLVRPAEAIQNDFERLTQNPDGSWGVRAFGQLLYPREPGMEALIIEYSAPDPDSPTASADVILEINYLDDEGRRENLFTRGMNSAKRPAERDLQQSTFTLPAQGTGEIEIRVVRAEDNSHNDRLIIHSLRAQGAGPDLVLGPERVLIPLESISAGEDRMRVKSRDGWVAHAPAYVTYNCPPDLRAITFGFGLDPAAYWTEQHTRRSDGIDAIVELVEPDGTVTELYKRSLDPFNAEGDRGTQQARVLVPGRPGRLTVRLTPGRYGSPAFDWSYLTNLSGELAP